MWMQFFLFIRGEPIPDLFEFCEFILWIRVIFCQFALFPIEAVRFAFEFWEVRCFFLRGGGVLKGIFLSLKSLLYQKSEFVFQKILWFPAIILRHTDQIYSKMIGKHVTKEFRQFPNAQKQHIRSQSMQFCWSQKIKIDNQTTRFSKISVVPFQKKI